MTSKSRKVSARKNSGATQAKARDRRVLARAAEEDAEGSAPASSTLRSIKAAEPARPESEQPTKGPTPAPRFAPDQARRELKDIVKALYKLNDNIIESHTNSDSSFGSEAFGDALQQVLGLRIILEDVAEGLVAKPAAEVQP